MSSPRARRWIKGEPKPNANALTCERWLLPSPYRSCECNPAAHHAEECWTTPIYAELAEELGSPWGWLHDLGIAAFCLITKGDNGR